MLWLNDWAKRIELTIDETKIDENLTNFPVLITLSGSEVFDSLTVSGGPDAYDVLYVDTRGDQSDIGAMIYLGQPSPDTTNAIFQTISGIRCLYFDGTDDIMYFASNTAYDFGATDFTIEAWINPKSLSSPYRIISYGAVDGTGSLNGSWAFGIGTAGAWGSGIRIAFDFRYSGTVYSMPSSDVSSYISINTWNHVAVVRSSGVLYFYLNGIQRGSTACSYDFTLASASNISLGYRYSSAYIEKFYGYLAKWRLSKGIARYTSTFTPPTTYTNDSYTKFMYMASDGDISPAQQQFASYGAPYLSRSTTPFNRNAAFDFGTGSNDFFHIANSSPQFDFGSNDFTIDGWAYIRSYDAGTRSIFCKRTSTSNYMWIFMNVSASGYLQVYVTNNGTSWGIFFTSSYVPVNTWFHFAFVRTGNTFDLYYNGIKTNTGTMSGAILIDSASFYLGMGDSAGNADWYGYMYGIRFSKGIARYSGNFTPGDPLEFNSSFTNRKKIAITDANNNQLYAEIERWDHANKKAHLWTKVPTVASGTNTKLYLYYDKNKSDNTNYIGDPTSVPAVQVWDSNFMAVYHLNSGFVSTSYILDSTVSGNHIVSAGGGISPANIIPSKIAQGLDLERTASQDCTVPSTVSLKGQAQASVEAIINLESHNGATTYYCAIYFEPTSTNAYTRFGLWTVGIDASTTRLETGYRDSSQDPAGSIVLLSDSYNLALSTNYYVATTYNSNTENYKLFRDNLKVGTNTTAKTAFGNSTTYGIKIGSNPTQYFDGIIDELRISKTERSEAWIKATYYSNWNDLITFSTPEYVPIYTCSGVVTVSGVTASGIPVCLYRRATGQLMDRTTTISGGIFQLDSPYNEEHYVVSLYTTSGTNAIIFDWIVP